MQSTKVRFVILGVALGLIVLGSILYLGNRDSYSKAEPDGTYTMVLYEEGYQPESLVIPLGATVVFSSQTGRAHWPASNMHPNHEIYPAFDPLEPVPANETWSFTFRQAGNWTLHDHLRSYYRGTITVLDQDSQ